MGEGLLGLTMLDPSKMTSKKILGIIGGMGPEATVYMFNRVVATSQVERDQDHIEIFIHNNTCVPDRTDSILHGGPSPLKELVRSARILQGIGANLLIMPCMTSHYYFDEVQRSVSIPIINAIEQTVLSASIEWPKIKRVGLLATTGTIRSGLFQNALKDKGIISLIPAKEFQCDLVMSAIYGPNGVKAGCKTSSPRNKLKDASAHLIDQGAEVIIGGCTEIPLVLRQEDVQVPFLDPMEVLAKVAVVECLGSQSATFEIW